MAQRLGFNSPEPVSSALLLLAGSRREHGRRPRARPAGRRPAAHDEREDDHTRTTQGKVPEYRSAGTTTLLVCKADRANSIITLAGAEPIVGADAGLVDEAGNHAGPGPAVVLVAALEDDRRAAGPRAFHEHLSPAPDVERVGEVRQAARLR